MSMIKTGSLRRQRCLPCEGGVKALGAAEIRAHLWGLPGWRYDAKEKAICLQLRMKNFAAAIRLIQKIARIAEKEKHHPDMHLTGYRHLAIVLSTHAIKGLSINDFILASRISHLQAIRDTEA